MDSTLGERRGTHLLGEHAQDVAISAQACRPDTHTTDQADRLMSALLQCIELVGGATAAVRPRAASPAHPAFSNRTRSHPLQLAPMNPVNHHHGSGASRRPGGDSDAGYWRHEYQRVDTHFDRCDVVRRAGAYLASLIARDLSIPAGEWTDDDTKAQVLIEGQGWDIETVAQRFRLTLATVAHYRIDNNRHPLTGRHWTPPTSNALAADAAREMKAAGLNSAMIGAALERSANTVRCWVTSHRRAA